VGTASFSFVFYFSKKKKKQQFFARIMAPYIFSIKVYSSYYSKDGIKLTEEKQNSRKRCKCGFELCPTTLRHCLHVVLAAVDTVDSENSMK
jgi:hypothetical protein